MARIHLHKMAMRTETRIDEFRTFLKTLNRNQIGNLVIQYLNEKDNHGWEEWQQPDVSVIGRFLSELKAFHEGFVEQQPDYFD